MALPATMRRFTIGLSDADREIYEELGSRVGKKRETREVTDFFAAGSAGLLLAGGALSMFWFRRAIP